MDRLGRPRDIPWLDVLQSRRFASGGRRRSSTGRRRPSAPDHGAARHRRRGVTLLAVLLVTAALAGCLDRARRPGAPQVAVDGTSIIVNGASPESTVQLYLADTDTEVASAETDDQGDAVFTGLAPGRYYVTQSLFGAESDPSDVVTVASIADLVATGGVERVDVTGAEGGATVTLYDGADAPVTTTTAADDGTATFTGVEPGLGYYVTQTIAGSESDPSNAVTVRPPAPTAAGGTNRVTVSGARGGATINVYEAADPANPDPSTDTLVATGTASAAGSVEIGDVPAGTAIYATQVVNQAESPPSGLVTVTGLQASGGVERVTVSGAESGATVTLYQAADPANPDPSADPQINETTAASTVVFNDAEPGVGYYATQTVGGERSDPSNRVNVRPPRPTLTGGQAEATVTDFRSGATLKLYGPAGSVVDTETSPTGSSHTFTGLDAGQGFRATQTVNDVESDKSSAVTVTGTEVSPPVLVSELAFPLLLNVTQVFDGATVALYRTTTPGDPDPSADDVVNETAEVGAEGFIVITHNATTDARLTPGVSYYATQTFEGNVSGPSNVEEVFPDAPDVSVPAGLTVQAEGFVGATFELVNGTGVSAATQTDGGSDDNLEANPGAVLFTNVEPGVNYTVRQWVSAAFKGPFTDQFDVFPPAPNVFANPDFPFQLNVTGAEANAEIELYNSTSTDPGNEEQNVTADADGNATLTDLNATKVYFVRQVFEGTRSGPTEALRVYLPVPELTGGAASATVEGEPNATYRLFNASAVVATIQDGGGNDTDNSTNGVVEFADLFPDATYQAQQWVVESVPSNPTDQVAVIPAMPTAESSCSGEPPNDCNEVIVTGYDQHATLELRLYRAVNPSAPDPAVDTLVQENETITGSESLFRAVRPSPDGVDDYYVVQVIQGAESRPDADGDAAGDMFRVDGLWAEPVLIGSDPGITVHNVTARNIDSSSVRLYDALTGEVVATDCPPAGGTEVTFTAADGVQANALYFARQIATLTCNGVDLGDESNPSNIAVAPS